MMIFVIRTGQPLRGVVSIFQINRSELHEIRSNYRTTCGNSAVEPQAFYAAVPMISFFRKEVPGSAQHRFIVIEKPLQVGTLPEWLNIVCNISKEKERFFMQCRSFRVHRHALLQSNIY
jgi:hypothetical protein